MMSRPSLNAVTRQFRDRRTGKTHSRAVVSVSAHTDSSVADPSRPFRRVLSFFDEDLSIGFGRSGSGVPWRRRPARARLRSSVRVDQKAFARRSPPPPPPGVEKKPKSKKYEQNRPTVARVLRWGVARRFESHAEIATPDALVRALNRTRWTERFGREIDGGAVFTVAAGTRASRPTTLIRSRGAVVRTRR